MTHRVVRMRIEAKVAEHELAEYIAKTQEPDERLEVIRDRLITVLDDGKEQAFDLAERVDAQDHEIATWKQRAIVAESLIKRQKVVGREVAKEDVLAILGDPATWEDEKILPEPQNYGPIAEAVMKLPKAPDIEEEIFEHERKQEEERENFKLLANELWAMTHEKEQASLQRNTARNRADAYEKILNLLVIDEQSWADQIQIIDVKYFVKAQNAVIADQRSKVDTEFPKEW